MLDEHHGTYIFGHEKRDSPREPKPGKAYLKCDSGEIIGCGIIDRSQKGARMLVDSLAQVPGYFALVDKQLGQMTRCSLKWRNGDQIGVRFISMPEPIKTQPRAASGTGGRLFGKG